MKKYLILGLLFSLSAYSHNDPNCIPAHGVVIDDLQKLLNWSGALDEDIKHAPCKTKSVPSEDEIKQFIASKSSGSKNARVHGVQFKNESPALIEAFKDFTTAMDSMGYYQDSDSQKKIQAEFQINPACDKVMCAMEKIWGKNLGQKMLYIKLKHNYNTSELAFKSSSRFNPHEMDQTLMGLEDLPSLLVPLGTPNQRLAHFQRGYTLKDYDSNVYANSVIMLFDSWGEQSAESMQFTVFHELAHNMSNKFQRMDESPAWLKMSGWIKKGDEWSAPESACFISNYGTTNPWEDFAETVSAYRYNAKGLMRLCPEKYAFIKDKVFKGLEYTSVKQCSPISEGKMQLAATALSEKFLAKLQDKEFSSEVIQTSCAATFKSWPLSQSDLASCGVKLHSKNLTSEIAEALKLAGIPDTATNRDLVIEEVSQKLQSNESILNEVAQKASRLNASIEALVDKSIKDRQISKKVISTSDYRWSTELRTCSEGLFEGKSEKTVTCLAEKIVKDDEAMQKWNAGTFEAYEAPNIFSYEARDALTKTRNLKLVEYLVQGPVGVEVQKARAQEFKRDMGYQTYYAGEALKQLSGWKKLSPEEFCRETYAKGSLITEKYGVKKGETVPGLQKICVEAQGQKTKRYEFKESEWKDMLEQLLPSV